MRPESVRKELKEPLLIYVYVYERLVYASTVITSYMVRRFSSLRLFHDPDSTDTRQHRHLPGALTV